MAKGRGIFKELKELAWQAGRERYPLEFDQHGNLPLPTAAELEMERVLHRRLTQREKLEVRQDQFKIAKEHSLSARRRKRKQAAIVSTAVEGSNWVTPTAPYEDRPRWRD